MQHPRDPILPKHHNISNLSDIKSTTDLSKVTNKCNLGKPINVSMARENLYKMGMLGTIQKVLVVDHVPVPLVGIGWDKPTGIGRNFG